MKGGMFVSSTWRIRVTTTRFHSLEGWRSMHTVQVLTDAAYLPSAPSLS